MLHSLQPLRIETTRSNFEKLPSLLGSLSRSRSPVTCSPRELVRLFVSVWILTSFCQLFWLHNSYYHCLGHTRKRYRAVPWRWNSELRTERARSVLLCFVLRSFRILLTHFVIYNALKSHKLLTGSWLSSFTSSRRRRLSSAVALNSLHKIKIIFKIYGTERSSF